MTENKLLEIKYFKGLDILRFIAASCVVLHHASQFINKKGFNIEANKYHIYSGSFFLDLFFVISGFLIALILFKELDANKFNLKKFFVRRILRIWPLFFLVVIVKVVLFPFMKGIELPEILYNLKFAATFTTNFQLIFGEYFQSTYLILWSVCIEEHIYLLFPFLALLFKQSRLVMISSLIVIGVFSLQYSDEIFSSSTNLSVPYFLSTSYLYYFGIGGLIAIAMTKYTKLFQKISDAACHWIIQVLIMGIGFALVFNTITNVPYSKGFQILLHGTFAAYLVFVAVSGNLIFDKFNLKTSRYLGNISYSMYLIHPMFLGIAFKLVIGRQIEVGLSKLTISYPFLAIAITIMIATILYYSVEKPFLKMKKKFAIVKSK